jgi:uncharacterized protein (DUF4415 family)
LELVLNLFLLISIAVERFAPTLEKGYVRISFDANTFAWFQSQGADCEKKMAAALKIYAEAHQVNL